MKKLTVIIPFLNEGEEVQNTVESIMTHGGDQTEIILINDASTDGYHYKGVAEDYGACYIEHARRQGVAASRDEGVERCTTPYFLLLDGHMRFMMCYGLHGLSENWMIMTVSCFVARRKC